MQGKEWEEVEETVKKAMKETELEMGGERRRRERWWDEDCERKKGEVRRELRK